MSAVQGFNVFGIVPKIVSITETNIQTVNLLWSHKIVDDAQNMHFSLFTLKVIQIVQIHTVRDLTGPARTSLPAAG